MQITAHGNESMVAKHPPGSDSSGFRIALGALAKGVTKPRGGARRAAIGPVLRRMRQEAAAENGLTN